MRPAQIVPDPHRTLLLDAIAHAEKLASSAASFGDAALINAAVAAQREAWLALERYDRPVR